MSRRGHFDDGHGREDFSISIPQKDVELYRGIANMSRNQADMDQHMRVQPTNLDDIHSLRQHLVSAHSMDPWETTHFDETAHGGIPSLNNRRRDWSGDTVPRLDHSDLHSMHHHEHTAGEYASDYPHTTVGSSHFHH
jgi:hypothetical protein